VGGYLSNLGAVLKKRWGKCGLTWLKLVLIRLAFMLNGSKEDPLSIYKLTRDPKLRWQDVAGGETLLVNYLADPSNEEIKELLLLKIEEQQTKAVLKGDPFLQNYMPENYKPPTANKIPFAVLPDGRVLTVSIKTLNRNLLLVGSTGSGKSSYLRLMILSLLEYHYAHNSLIRTEGKL
jgi:hypothetical protein